MKKLLILLLICLFSTGMIFATNIDGFESLSSQATYGLFGNEMDDASSVGSGFSALEDDYLFGGVIANPEQQVDGGVNPSFVTGYYHTSDMPWSVFAYMNMANANQAAVTSEDTTYNPANENESATVTYDVPTYKAIDTQFQFLMDYKGYNTGLKLDIYLLDNRVAADNATLESNWTGNPYMAGFTGDASMSDENGSESDYKLTIPFYMVAADMEHKAEVSYRSEKFDYSTASDSETTAGTTSSSENEDVRQTTWFGLDYSLTMELGNGDLTPFIGYTSEKYSRDQSTSSTSDGVNVNSTETTQTWKNGSEFYIGANYAMTMEPTSWMTFKLKPEAYYNRSAEPYMTKQEIKTTVGTAAATTTSTSGAVDSDITNTIGAQLFSAVEIQPEDWFFGFQMGSRMYLSRAKQTLVSEDPDSTDTAGVTTEDNDTDTQEAYSYTSGVDMEYGFFVPLPDDYRLDFKLNANDLTDFEQVSVELIVPLK